jgi:glycosyltransferase involved in cell wall biosynthesis
MVTDGKDYIIITPAKNEEGNLPGLLASIRNQKSKPKIWVIVDDGSTDNTPNLIRQAESEDSWIHGLFLSSAQSYNIEEHYADVCRYGFHYAIHLAENSNVFFHYIALSDADMLYPENYFSSLIDFLETHQNFGIISGSLSIKDKNGIVYQESKVIPGNDHVLGTGRVWRLTTFNQTGGYLKVRAPDQVSTILALCRGWKTAQLPEIICFQTRDTGGKNTLWQGYFKRGQRLYYLTSNFLSIGNMIFDILFISRQKNSLTKSLALFCGYCYSVISRDEQIPIQEVRLYTRSYKRIFQLYVQFIQNLFSKNH